MESYKSETRSQKAPPVGQTNRGEYKWYQERPISFGSNKKGELKEKRTKRKRLPRENNRQKKENVGE